MLLLLLSHAYVLRGKCCSTFAAPMQTQWCHDQQDTLALAQHGRLGAMCARGVHVRTVWGWHSIALLQDSG